VKLSSPCRESGARVCHVPCDRPTYVEGHRVCLRLGDSGIRSCGYCVVYVFFCVVMCIATVGTVK
jgi:hypothetical protein